MPFITQLNVDKDNPLPVEANVTADVTVNAAAIPTDFTAYNLPLVLDDTEYSQALPATCLAFEFRCRSGAVVRWSNVTGKVAAPTAPYLTLAAGDSYSSPASSLVSNTLYFAGSAGTVVEIIAWS